jgi:competence protein ComEA
MTLLAAVGHAVAEAASAGHSLLLPPQTVEINTANQAELEQVRGIGPDLSKRILESRRQARFANWADFMQRLAGVGPVRALKLSQAGLVINGLGRPGTDGP